ncbi:MAG: sugar transferase [Dysgonamonadaceae bacterium]|jgi:lipopolysaccharide/colanic/teichoic acid biosynthesis glycosyltransferase|nr:sugar transferase [Dysgonamonadaceae bacterium]
MYKYFFKRLIDFSVALCGLILLSPLIGIVVVLLYFANRGKVFFYQDRPGKDCKIFRIVKFKTMNDKKDGQGNLLPDMERLSKTGRFIRNTSLDEIPQLWNVLKGDMSLIGPRPLLVEYLPLYDQVQIRRHEVRPGMTGWAQVNGRNAISWQQKFQWDVRYVDQLSFTLDAKILYKTILKVIRLEGINAGQTITMEKFTGHSHENPHLKEKA